MHCWSMSLGCGCCDATASATVVMDVAETLRDFHTYSRWESLLLFLVNWLGDGPCKRHTCVHTTTIYDCLIFVNRIGSDIFLLFFCLGSKQRSPLAAWACGWCRFAIFKLYANLNFMQTICLLKKAFHFYIELSMRYLTLAMSTWIRVVFMAFLIRHCNIMPLAETGAICDQHKLGLCLV